MAARGGRSGARASASPVTGSTPAERARRAVNGSAAAPRTGRAKAGAKARATEAEGADPVVATPAPNPYGEVQDSESLSPKGRRTREKLLTGARRAFEKSGSYVDTRIADIAKESKVAYGSFYTYFDSKEQLFYELAVSVVDEMYRQGTSSYRGDDPVERMDSANRQFLRSYRDHAVMMTIIEQAAALYPELRDLRRRLREQFVDRIAANLERLEARGVADKSLNPRVAAHALVSMTDNFGYLWFVLGEQFDEEEAFSTLTQLWANAVGIRR